MRPTWRVLLAGVLGSAVLLALIYRPTPIPPAEAQGVGIFQRLVCNTTTLTSPVAGQSWCFDQTTRILYAFDGTGFVAITPDVASRTFTAVGGQTNLGNFVITPTPIGTTQQVALGAQIQGAATGTATNRIAGYFGAQTSDTGTDTPTGLNVVVQQGANAHTVQIIGQELDFNSNKADATLDMSPAQVGFSAVSGGSKKAGSAYVVSGTPQWIEGYRVDQGAIATGGWAFRYKGDGASGGIGIRADDTLEIGFFSTSLGSSNEIHLSNQKSMQGLNVAGLAMVQMMRIGSNNNVEIDTGNAGTVHGGGISVGAGTAGVPGVGSLNVASATLMNGLASQVASGSGVNLANVRGISGAASSTLSNNLRGSCAFAAAVTCAVTFANNEPNANYFVMVGGIVTISNKLTTGFTMTATGTTSNSVDWLLVR